MNDNMSNENPVGFIRGDAEVWRQLLNRLVPQLYGMFMKRWANPSLAEELLQKTVFDAIKGRKSYDVKQAGPEEWIFGIARNNIRLEIRKRAARPTVDGDLSSYLEAIDTELLPDEVLEKKETAMIVRDALSSLQGNEKKVLKAKYLDNLSARDIAKEMAITEKAVHSLLYRARNSLRQELIRIAPLSKGEQRL